MTQLGYQCMDDWYSVTADDIEKNGGRQLLSSFRGPPSRALQSIYPEHNWMLWRFKTVPHGYWEQKENQTEFFDRLYVLLGYKCMDDWYNVTQKDIHKNGGAGVLLDYKGSPSLA